MSDEADIFMVSAVKNVRKIKIEYFNCAFSLNDID